MPSFFRQLGFKMSIKLKYRNRHIGCFFEDLRDLNEEYDEQLHEDLRTM